MEKARWPDRAGCYGGLGHVYGRLKEAVAESSGAVASSGLSSMVMGTWADVDLEWISRSIIAKPSLVWTSPRQGQPSLFQGTAAAGRGPGGPVQTSVQVQVSALWGTDHTACCT